MRRIIAMLVLSSGLIAQETPDHRVYDATVISVKTLSGDSFERLVKLLNVFPAKITGDERLRTIVVYAHRDVVAKIKSVVDQLDRPGSEAAIGHNIDLTLSFLRCSPKTGKEAGSVPAELQAVAKQLRAATQCPEVTLWHVLPMRIQEGKKSQQIEHLPLTLENLPGISTVGTIFVEPVGVTKRESGRYVRFERLAIFLKFPQVTGNLAGNKQWQYSELRMDTSGDFKEGQKSVMGKLSGLEPNTSLFVVVELKVLD